MQLLPYTTTHGKNGPVHTIELGHTCVIQVLPAPDFDNRVSRCADHHRGRHYEIAACTENGTSVILIKNAKPPSKEHIDRDDTWHRRIELASILPGMLDGKVELSLAEIKHLLPLSLRIPSYKEAISPNATTEDVLRISFANTQQRFEQVVESYLTGELKYDLVAYSQQGVSHPDYNHIAHFGWIYAQQIELVSQILRAHPDRNITVVDLATGSGHFMLTLAKQLAEKKLSARVRLIGIDWSEHDMQFARERLAAEVYRIDFDFVKDDLECPGFADRLRRHRPDVIVANHVIEHLPGEIQNRYLQDWLLAAKIALSISVPLEDDLGCSISQHVHQYTVEAVEQLARSMEIRVGFAVEAPHIEETKYGGLFTWLRKSDILSRGGFDGELLTLKPKGVEIQPHPIVEDFAKPFDPAEFAKARKAPKIGTIQNEATFQQQEHEPRQVRQFLIKMPGTDIKLPREFAQFEEAVQIIIDHNNAVSPEYDHSYAYLNFFRGLTLFSSYRGLSLNCHGDQLQCLRPEYAFKPDFSYIVSNTLPTILYDQPFDLTEALERFRAGENINLYDYMNSQADERFIYRSENFGIYLLSPYVVHSAAAADRDVYRVFMKVAFSAKRFFDNRELRRNPAFDNQDWYLSDTVGYGGGWLSHAHWNERFLKDDVCPA